MAVPLVAAGAVAAKGGAVAASGGATSAAGGSAAASGGAASAAGGAATTPGAASASTTGSTASHAGSGSSLGMGQSSPVGTPGSGSTSGKGMANQSKGSGNNLDDKLMRRAAENMSQEDEEKKKERKNQKDLSALQKGQAGGAGKGLAGGGMSKGKLISSAAKILPGGDFALDIAVVLAGASIIYFPWAFDIMKDDGLSKRNIYRLLAMILIWAAILFIVIFFVVYIATCVSHPIKCGWSIITN